MGTSRMTQINHLGNFHSRSVPAGRYNSRMDIEALVAEIDAEIHRLQQVRSLLTGHTPPLKRGRPLGKKPSASALPKRTMSPEGRARIVAAQKARWAKTKKK
jgi:hypothetical protein